jgi:hypothetical protein
LISQKKTEGCAILPFFIEKTNMHTLPKSLSFLLAACLPLLSANAQPYAVQSHDGTATCPFGTLDYRVFFPENFTDTACVLHVSRGGNGLGDDRSQLLPYVNHYVQNGYAVVQVDHRFAGNDIPKIAQFRGEEIACIADKAAAGSLDWGSFQGTIDAENQGFAGHSGGCMEGLEAAGTAMTHGNYFVPQIKAMFGMSPAGFAPDQFGIQTDPPGYAAIDQTAVFLVLGEQEKDVNGTGTFMATDWRLQPFDAMTENAPRFEAVFQGSSTAHNDISLGNADIVAFNQANSLAFFDVFLKNKNRLAELGTLSLPPANPLVFSKKGLTTNATQIIENQPAVRILPNPASDFLTVEMAGNTALDLAVFDVFGKKIFEQTGCTSPCRVDLGNRGLNQGIYFLELKNRGILWLVKFLFLR